jgi:hypothetical protein
MWTRAPDPKNSAQSTGRQRAALISLKYVALCLLLGACDDAPKPPASPRALPKLVRPAGTLDAALTVEPSADAQRRWSPTPEVREEIAKTRGGAWRHAPQPLPPQRLAFFARNLAALQGDAVWALPIRIDHVKNQCNANRLSIEAPRELTTLADQTLLVLGAKATLMVDSNCQTTLKLPKVSYIPGSRLFPEPRWPRSFALFDSPSGSFSRFRWEQEPKADSDFLLPMLTIEDPNIKNGACSLMRDGALACVNGEQLFLGWPGHPTHALGKIAHGASVVRVLPADRVDHARTLRSDSYLEEYWLTRGLPKTRGFALPQVAFDVSSGNGYLAILQVESAVAGATDVRLVVLEPGGTLRWSLLHDRVSTHLNERQRVRAFFECLNLATHPTRPTIAVSNCDRIDLLDARDGKILQRIDRPAH